MDAIENNTINPDNFCLKWSNYQAHVMGLLVQLLEAESLVDVTLCSSTGDKLRAHKVVLCAASSYFEEIFCGVSEDHLVVILSDVETHVLRSILYFVYHGELNVDATQLNDVLQVAATLQIRGLTEVSDQLPQLVPASVLPLHPNQQSCNDPKPSSPLQTVASEEIVRAYYCDTDTQTLKVPDVEYTNTITQHLNQIEDIRGDSICGVEDKEINETDSNIVPETHEESCLVQKENWTRESSNIICHNLKKRKRRESCRREYSEEQLAAALSDLRGGQLLRETALSHNIPRSTLYVRAKAEGIPITVTRQEHSGENVNAAVQAVRKGASLQQASEMYQIPKTVLWRRVKAAGAANGRPPHKRRMYNSHHWQQAVQALQDGQNLTRVSAQFQIPKTTLFREKSRLVEAGKLCGSSTNRRDPQYSTVNNSRLKEAVAACKEGKMSQAVASITYQVPKTTIWRRLQRGTQQSSEQNAKTVRSIEIDSPGVEGIPMSESSTLQEQPQFTFIDANSQLPVTYIVEEDFSTSSLIM